MLWEVNSDIRKNPVDVVFEVSQDLSTWQEVPSEKIIGATSLTYRMNLPLNFNTQFIRLRARLED
jgi:hypothetical protein